MKITSKILFAAALVSVAAVSAHPAYAQLAAPNDAGVTFSHVHLYVTDIELHKKLWSGLFDGVLVEKERFAAVRLPGVLVFLTEGEPTAPSLSTTMDHFGFKVRDVESILMEWRALGYEVDREFEGAGGLPGAYITMPDGVRLELQEDPELSVKAEMDHVHFFTPQYGELPAWYADLFGATPRSGSEVGMTADVPGASLIFDDWEEDRMPTESTVIDHIGFEVKDMDAFVEMLKARDVELVFGPRYVESLELWVAFFTDPSGVLVEASEGLDKY